MGITPVNGFTAPIQGTPWVGFNIPAVSEPAVHGEKELKANLPLVYTITNGQPIASWPPIFRAIHAQNQQAFETILNQAGRVSVSIPKRPPEAVLKAIETLSVKTQETFISTWLSRFITEGVHPVITEQDRAKTPQANFDQLLQTISQYADSQVQMTATGADVNLLSGLNAQIAPLRKEIMASNIEFESYNERAKTAKGIFYSVAGTSALGYAIQYVPFLKPLERYSEVIMSQVDDYGNWAGEIASVKGQGYSWKQVLSSQWLALPAIAWTMLADLSFKERAPVLDKNGAVKKRFGKALYQGIRMDHWPSRLARGVKYGVACGALSVAASLSTLGLMAFQHRKLLREGKAQETTNSSKGFRSYWNSIKSSFKQDIQYPARVGLFLGSALAIMSTGAAALIKVPGFKNKKSAFLLSMVLVQALAGIGETVGAAVASISARKRNESHLNKIMTNYAPNNSI